MPCTVSSVSNGELVDEEWPALFAKRHMKEESIDPQRLSRVWRGEDQDVEYAEAAIIATAAIALRLMGKADSQDAALEQATGMWQQRDKNRH